MRKRLATIGVLTALVFQGGSCSGSNDPKQILAELIALEKIFGPIDNGGLSLLGQIDSNRWDAPVGGLTCWSAPSVDKKAPTHSGTDIISIGLSGKYIGADDLIEINSQFPEGQGSLGYSVYGGSSFSPGWYMFAWMAMKDDVAINDDTRFYDYAAVFDMDDNSSNNYAPSSSFPDDFFIGTDYWLRLQKSPGNPWTLGATDARDNEFENLVAEARAMVCDNAIVFMLPMTGFPMGATYYPPYRMTTFTHPGDFGENSGDWSGTTTRSVTILWPG
ncbi:MAG: hypothetical protein V3T86_08765 [Planctomycetota bacterium]